MKLYLIAASLFVLAFLILGVLTASLMNGPETPKQPPRASTGAGLNGGAENASHGGGGLTGPASLTTPPGGAGFTPPPRPATPQGIANEPFPGTAPSANAPILLPRAPPMQPSPTVPIIQPTDLGTPTTPTAAKSHQ